MATSIDKRDREYAKQNGEFLFQIMLDARYVPAEVKDKLRGKVTMGYYSEAGALSPKNAAKLYQFFQKLTREEISKVEEGEELS